ncbi:MAG TPA: hypothetical protein PK605_00240 [Ignavibacteria bacterium]|nr:hypothetical protein [Bacteroidota bacterium]HRE10792.1 hypothetical protein [Ignavibacteria bacterium]HRF65965.1 hypothetical protein [Ignavibacteria bacterium]HRJ02807.1 hypothetical protein [Ignavibacteria bacterium]HRJ84364.1 hypothetical protein [Ignavibacteria bacterium]
MAYIQIGNSVVNGQKILGAVLDGKHIYITMENNSIITASFPSEDEAKSFMTKLPTELSPKSSTGSQL